MVNVWPTQIEPLFTVIVGSTNTVDVTAAVAEQPAVVVPVTLYVVFDAGLTVITELVELVFHE